MTRVKMHEEVVIQIRGVFVHDELFSGGSFRGTHRSNRQASDNKAPSQSR